MPWSFNSVKFSIMAAILTPDSHLLLGISLVILINLGSDLLTPHRALAIDLRHCEVFLEN
jgi:hypothetical protein